MNFKIKEALQQIENTEGMITASQVVRNAQDEHSPLHDLFTWDDTVAAHKWRIREARQLIRTVKIDVQMGNETIRTVAYVKDVNVPNATEGYIALGSVKRRDTTSLVASELKRIASLVHRARGIAEFKSNDLPEGLLANIKKMETLATRILAALEN